MNDSPLPLYTQLCLQVQGYSFSSARKITQATTSFITPLGNAAAINMMRMKSFHVYLTAPRRVASSVLTQHSAHVKDLTHHLGLQVLLSVLELTVCMTGSSSILCYITAYVATLRCKKSFILRSNCSNMVLSK